MPDDVDVTAIVKTDCDPKRTDVLNQIFELFAKSGNLTRRSLGFSGEEEEDECEPVDELERGKLFTAEEEVDELERAFAEDPHLKELPFTASHIAKNPQLFNLIGMPLAHIATANLDFIKDGVRFVVVWPPEFIPSSFDKQQRLKSLGKQYNGIAWNPRDNIYTIFRWDTGLTAWEMRKSSVKRSVYSAFFNQTRMQVAKALETVGMIEFTFKTKTDMGEVYQWTMKLPAYPTLLTEDWPLTYTKKEPKGESSEPGSRKRKEADETENGFDFYEVDAATSPAVQKKQQAVTKAKKAKAEADVNEVKKAKSEPVEPNGISFDNLDFDAADDESPAGGVRLPIDLERKLNLGADSPDASDWLAYISLLCRKRPDLATKNNLFTKCKLIDIHKVLNMSSSQLDTVSKEERMKILNDRHKIVGVAQFLSALLPELMG